MNWHLLHRRLRGKPTLVMGTASTIGQQARILNAGSESNKITIGTNSRIEGELFVFAHGGQITIGDWCFIGPSTRIWSAREIIIGNRVLISHSVTIMDSLTHPLSANERHMQYREILTSSHPKVIDLDEKRVVLNDDVWIGASAIILRGVQIGNCYKRRSAAYYSGRQSCPSNSNACCK
jgi:acetyltransferase-like isoleucine patch superfamily enzyme